VWTDDTTRATALTTQDGIYVKNGDATRRYLGTIRITATTGQCEDSALNRLVWNYYNQVARDSYSRDTTDSWTNNGNGTWSIANNANANWKHTFIVGVAGCKINATASLCGANSNSSGACVAIGYDSATTPNAAISSMAFNNLTSALPIMVELTTYPTAGSHYIAILNTSSNTGAATFYGDGGGYVGGGNLAIQSYMITQMMR